ncbi:MAG: transposase [Flavobacteriaceae bacterium]|nr:transposase [Flavobacteriaceae bacterium]MCY4298188.1 transposase [Flavobacteriaceae bacterium]
MEQRQHTPEFKFKVVKEALKERHSIQELARRFLVGFSLFHTMLVDLCLKAC